jgi:hypothetical protein
VDKHQVIGIEPTDIADMAQDRGIRTVKTFFNADTARKINGWTSSRGRNIVTCANCFAHMTSVPDIMTGIRELIGDDGVFVSESHYLMSLLDSLQYDTIYHEHLRYYSLHSISYLLHKFGLEVFHVKKIPTHGGSIRVYARKLGSSAGIPTTSDVRVMMDSEPHGADLVNKLKRFAKDVRLSKLQLMSKMFDYRLKGYTVAGISAPSRAATVINYCRLELDYVVELPGSLKIGKCMPGTNIPVGNENILFGSDQPQAAVLFSWHIADEIIPKLRAKGYRGEICLPCARWNQSHDHDPERDPCNWPENMR